MHKTSTSTTIIILSATTVLVAGWDEAVVGGVNQHLADRYLIIWARYLW